jgi:two-component system LytT family response regulator
MEDFRFNTLILGSDKATSGILEEVLSSHQGFNLITIEDQTEIKLETILKKHIDLVFLDIAGIHDNGFGLVRSLNQYHLHPAIVMISTNQEHAYMALKSGVFDYLLKPLDREEVKGTIQKFFNFRNNKLYHTRFELLLKKLINHHKVRFANRSGFIFIEPDDILYIEAEGNYSSLFISGKENVMVTNSLGQIQQILPNERFYRINRSTIINLSFLKEIRRKEKICCLVRDQKSYTFNISSRYLRELQEIYPV